MKRFFRLLCILRTFARYRIDEMLPQYLRPWKLKVLFAPFKLWPSDLPNDLDDNPGRRLRLALESLGPIFIKFGQLLSTRPDLLPPDIAQELNALQDDVAPFPTDVFREVVENALGQPLDSAFRNFSDEPLASASIAQVHTATLPSGEDVVIKAVRPGIEDIIETDVQLMLWLAERFVSWSPDGERLRPVEVVKDYRDTITDELDLLKETGNASQLKRHFDKSPLLYVPTVYWDYCRRNMLVMERIYGVQVTDIAELEAQNVNRKVLAERGVEIFFTQVFDNNFFHADMHPGNVYVDITNPELPSYISLDMAIVGSLAREDQFYLARNLLAMFRRDYRQVAELHVLSGWVPPGTPIGAFESAIRTVCEPIFEKPIKEISFGDALITLFQTARRFNMPIQPQLVLLQKTLVNIEGLGRQLYPDLDLWQTAHPFLERWLRKRFHPKTVYREFKRQAPEILEQLPELPHKLFNTLELTQRYLEVGSRDNEQGDRRKSRYRKQMIAVAAFAGAFYFYWPIIQQMPVELWAFIAVGVASLWRRD